MTTHIDLHPATIAMYKRMARTEVVSFMAGRNHPETGEAVIPPFEQTAGEWVDDAQKCAIMFRQQSDMRVKFDTAYRAQLASMPLNIRTRFKQ